MKRSEFNIVVEARLKSITEVLLKKGQEYASSTDVFHNFKNSAGLSFHTCPEKIAWEFMVKHLRSIKDMLDHVDTGGYNGHPSEALIEEKMGDAINYLILIEGMLKERIKNEHQQS